MCVCIEARIEWWSGGFLKVMLLLLPVLNAKDPKLFAHKVECVYRVEHALF